MNDPPGLSGDDFSNVARGAEGVVSDSVSPAGCDQEAIATRQRDLFSNAAY
jgi:hypothetical protein